MYKNIKVSVTLTLKVTGVWRDSLKYGRKSLILCQFIYSVTLTLTLNFLFKAYCHDILTNAKMCSIFLKEEA